MADAVAERVRERERLVGLARDYVAHLAVRHEVMAAAVVGSVARGDFNVWSDVDVVVVVEHLPDRVPDRATLLAQHVPAGVQPVGFTPAEFRTAWTKGNPLVRETAAGIALLGEGFLRLVASGG
ncbi:MAG: nucleotidyltransferase domain-containing protein [Actinomycetota bacterium]|nr:nucleotidyltransferase domain-containing protein [Actinomycetota bacterium]